MNTLSNLQKIGNDAGYTYCQRFVQYLMSLRLTAEIKPESLSHLEMNCTENIMLLKRGENILDHLKHLGGISNLSSNGPQMDNFGPGCMQYHCWGQTAFSGRVCLASDSGNLHRCWLFDPLPKNTNSPYQAGMGRKAFLYSDVRSKDSEYSK